MSPLAYPPASAAAAATRAVAWLAASWPPRAADAEALVIEALALLHLCRLAGAGACPSAAALEDEILRSHAEPRWTATSLSTSLLAVAGALRRGGAVARSAQAYLDGLGELEREGCLGGPGGVLVRLSMRGMTVAHSDRRAAVDVQPRPGDRAVLLATLSEIEVASIFGCVPIEAPERTAVLLDGAAMATLRAYDLPLGMRSLRARAYLSDADSAGVQAGREYLGLLQGDDGSFGDFDTALRRVVAAGEQDGELRVKLPVTLHAIWTMAELEDPTFRLARQVRVQSGRHDCNGDFDVVQGTDRDV